MFKKSKLGAKLFVIIVIAIFLTSTATVMFYNPDKAVEKQETIKYKNLEFTKDALSNMYTEESSGLVLLVNPAETEQVSSSFDVSLIKNSQKIYIVFNPNSASVDAIKLAAQQVATATQEVLKKKTVIAYTDDADPVDPDVPLKTCADATISIPVIEIRLGETKIYQQGNCLIVQGRGEQLSLVSARFALDIL